MPLELKGLKEKALTARRHIDRLNRAYDGFNEAAPAHARDVEGIAGDIEAMTDDLAAAARILGNSVNGSDAGAAQETVQTISPQAAVPEPVVTQNAPAGISESFSAARAATETANKSAGNFHDV